MKLDVHSTRNECCYVYISVSQLRGREVCLDASHLLPMAIKIYYSAF